MLPSPLARTETKNDTGRRATGMNGVVSGAESDVVELRAERDVAREPEIEAAAGAPGKSVGRSGNTAGTRREVVAADQELNERRDAIRVAVGQARTEKVGIRVGTYAVRRSVVGAEIARDPEPLVGVAGERDGAAIGVSAVPEPFPQIGIPHGKIGCGRLLGTQHGRKNSHD